MKAPDSGSGMTIVPDPCAKRRGRPSIRTCHARPRLAAWTASFLSARGAAAFPHLTAAVQRWRDALGLDDVPVPGYPALAT